MSKPFPRPQALVRPLVHRLHAYVPGEQPKVRGLIKLNTNENPYPPAPHVLAAVKAAVNPSLRLYPSPTADGLRAKLAERFGTTPDHFIVGNGSDELLALAVRAFVEPSSTETQKRPGRATVQYFWPSFSVYPVLADIHGARANAVPLGAEFALPTVSELRKGRRWDFRAALTFITTPNAPSGRGYTRSELATLCEAMQGVVVLDEAYVDFAEENALALALKYPHVLVCRTFSKAYSLCAQRVGYLVGNPVLIAGLQKIRDTYNVNGLGQVAAVATLEHHGYYDRVFQRVKKTRERLRRELLGLGWEVAPSSTNFLWCRPAGPDAETWLGALRAKKILVRWFTHSDLRDRLRITVGSEAEADALLKAIRSTTRRQR